MILTGCVAFAQHVGPSRAEAELLPQCWEQVSQLVLYLVVVSRSMGILSASGNQLMPENMSKRL